MMDQQMLQEYMKQGTLYLQPERSLDCWAQGRS